MNKVLDAMPIIVSNYAKMFGIRVRMIGSQAYTNGSVITIPRIDVKDELSARIAYGYLAHEAAHVRYTDFDEVRNMNKDFLLFSIFNILEDARVEHIISREFIGVFENLELIMEASEDLWRKFAFDIENISFLRILLSTLLYYSESKIQGYKSQKYKAAFLIRHLRKHHKHRDLNYIFKCVRLCNFAKKTHDISVISLKIYNFLKHEFKFSYDVKRKDPSCEDEANLDFSYKGSFLKMIADLAKEAKNDLGNLLPYQSAESLLAQRVPQNLTIRDDMGMIESGICPKGRDDFLDFILDTYPLRRALAQKVKAFCEAYGMQTLSGKKLNVQRLANIKAGETRIFKDRILYDDYATSVQILVDVSGSMLFYDMNTGKSRCEEACQAALMIALALEGIDGIKTMVTFFPGAMSEFDVALYVNEKAHNKAPFFDQKAHGSTPLAQVLWYSAANLYYLNCQRNIIFVLTDGIPDSISQARAALCYLKTLKAEVYGIGIQSEFISELIEHSESIKNIGDLKETMLKFFSNMFNLKK